MANEFADKQHVLLFRTRSGELLLGTNRLDEVAVQSWFRQFLNILVEERQSAVPSSAPARPPVRSVNPMDIAPDAMNDQVWETLTADQRRAYYRKWGLQE